MDDPGSVTRLIEQLRSSDQPAREEAARLVWDRYARALLELARNHLDHRVRQRTDEEDVVQSMYASFCSRQRRGEFDLAGRDDLWRLLVSVTLHKTWNTVRRHRRQARDYRREQIASGCAGGDRDDSVLDPIDPGEPTPADAAALNDELEHRLLALDDPILRRIALLKLEGHTNSEIARELDNCTERTIERKLARIRDKWSRIEEPGG
jgi:RNA polymerase sigma factor (sigma-70 family)